jgi:hypothetical protein
LLALKRTLLKLVLSRIFEVHNSKIWTNLCAWCLLSWAWFCSHRWVSTVWKLNIAR